MDADRAETVRQEGESPREPSGSQASLAQRNVITEARPLPLVPFAHPSEAEFAKLLDFYGVRWLYEPRSFPLRWEGGRVVEMLTPDFYLPDLGLYVELTTLKQSLVTEKNRKLRHLRELYPDVNIKLLYKRDYHRLLAKYGYGPLAQENVRGINRVLITGGQLQRRVASLGKQISTDYLDKQPVLIGVLKGVFCFMSDLIRHITVPLSVEFMSISYYSEGGPGVRITKDLDTDITGQHVLMVEDIVDTGMTLHYLVNYLYTRRPASLKVCTLLDKRVRRLAEVALDYVGFEIPDEFVVGYGLDYLERYRNLPFIGVLKPEANEEPQQPPRRRQKKRSK
ncbi:MAG: hypoxanthine phosphoribosyltransferase [Dehalococcoidia bacterium]